MVTKILLLVCLVPMVMGSPEEMMKMMMKMKEMMGGDMGGMGGDMGGDMGGMGGDMGGMGGDMGGDMGGMGDDYMEKKKEHYAGDGDCESKEEAMMKKYAMMKKFGEMMKFKAMMEKKKKMMEQMEKFKKFHMFMEMAHKKKEAEAMEQKKKMYEMWQKYEMMKKKKEHENEFKDLIEGFQEQKHKFAFSLTHHFLTLCKCGEINYQMSKMFMDQPMNNDTDMTGDMAEESAMEAWASGNMAELAMKLKKMSPEQQKHIYMAGLIKSMCAGAKAYVMHAKKFEETYMMGPAPTTPSGMAG